MKTSKKQRYQTIPRTLAFIRENDNYLLIQKKNENSFGYKKLNGVGGHMEIGEEPYESAEREIKEETNLHVENLELTAILFIDTNSIPGIQVFVFKADYCGGVFKASEEGLLKWMSRKEIFNSADVVFDVPKLIKICESHCRNSEVSIIKYLYNDAGELRIVNRL